MDHNPLFSIIFPVWHAGDLLRNALLSLRHLDFPTNRFEVIVSGARDDIASKKTVEAVAAGSPMTIRYVQVECRHRPKQLNEACRQAEGDWLVFADDDCILFRDWLSRFVEVIESESNPGVVGGMDELEPNDSAFHLALDYSLQSFIGTGGLRRGKGPRVGKYYPRLWNMAVSREQALAVARPSEESGFPCIFDETLDIYEEVDLVRRLEKADRRIVFARQVRVGHRRDTTLSQFIMRGFQKAYTSRALGVHRFSHVFLATLSLAALGLIVAAFFSTTAAWIACLAFSGYFILLLVTGVRGGIQKRCPGVVTMVVVVLVILHFSHGIGYLAPVHRLWSRPV